jgi:hypothetical protein
MSLSQDVLDLVATLIAQDATLHDDEYTRSSSNIHTCQRNALVCHQQDVFDLIATLTAQDATLQDDHRKSSSSSSSSSGQRLSVWS